MLLKLHSLVIGESELPMPPLSQSNGAREFPPAHIRDRAISRDDHAALSLHVDGAEILAGDLHVWPQSARARWSPDAVSWPRRAPGSDQARNARARRPTCA